MASAASTPAREAPRGFAPAAGSDEPIRPVAVRTVSVKPPAIKGAKNAPAAAPTPTPAPAPTVVAAATPAAPQPEPEAPATVRAEAPTPVPAPARAGTLGFLPAPARTHRLRQRRRARTDPRPGPGARAGPRNPATRGGGPAGRSRPPRPCRQSRPPQTRSGWVIQVGAYPAESEAKERLALAKSKASRLLAAASPFTETVQRGETTLYRARFAGLEREQAEAACKFLKRNDVDCLAMKN